MYGLVLSVFVLMFLFIGNASAQTSDDYLKSLQGEAETVTLDHQTELKTQSVKTQDNPQGLTGAAQGSGLVAGLTIEQFESVLKESYIGSYLFYHRLSDAKKGEVFASYQENPDPDSVREIILKVSKK